MNKSSYSDTFSYTFEKINRSSSVFPERLNKMPGIRKFCDFVFTHADEDGKLAARTTAGVVLARMIPGEGDYVVFDLVPRKNWGRMCKPCSNMEQRPVYHKKEKSKCGIAMRGLARAADAKKKRANLSQPNPNRISGSQIPRKRNPKPQEKKMLVKDIKAALLALGVPAHEYAGLLKDPLHELYVQKRDAAAVPSGAASVPSGTAPRKKKKRKLRRVVASSEDDVADPANPDDHVDLPDTHPRPAQQRETREGSA